MPYIGDYQFRFIAGVNRTFYTAYTTKVKTTTTIIDNSSEHNINYNNKVTYYNVSTIQHTKLCFEEATTVSERRKLCALAAKDGNLHILQFLKEELHCPWDWSTCSMGAKYGHLHIVQYARQNQCDWNDYTCINAAMNGHLHILQWACTNGFDSATMSIFVSSSAAERGHLNVLRWLHAMGVPFHECVTQYAGENGHEVVTQWLCARGY